MGKKKWIFGFLMAAMMACNQAGENYNKPTIEKAEVTAGTSIGQMAPNISGASPDGTTYELYDVRGQVVLLDFWASWCPPCRIENPNIVSNFQVYKNKDFKNGNGFTVFSVSLDKEKEQWKAAIASDNLDWPYHISDLKGWGSAPAAHYGVETIPSNYLINGDGIIIAKDVREQALEEALQSYLK